MRHNIPLKNFPATVDHADLWQGNEPSGGPQESHDQQISIDVPQHLQADQFMQTFQSMVLREATWSERTILVDQYKQILSNCFGQGISK